MFALVFLSAEASASSAATVASALLGVAPFGQVAPGRILALDIFFFHCLIPIKRKKLAENFAVTLKMKNLKFMKSNLVYKDKAAHLLYSTLDAADYQPHWLIFNSTIPGLHQGDKSNFLWRLIRRPRGPSSALSPHLLASFLFPPLFFSSIHSAVPIKRLEAAPVCTLTAEPNCHSVCCCRLQCWQPATSLKLFFFLLMLSIHEAKCTSLPVRPMNF